LAFVKKLLASPLLAAVVGGGVTAGVLLGAGVLDSGNTTTVYQQAPLSATRPASDDRATAGLTPREIYKRDAPGVVFIQARTLQPTTSPFDMLGGDTSQDREATGSGFVLDSDGRILTNAHVVNGATSVSVTFGDKTVRDAEIVGKDESTDLALLKVDPKGLDLRPMSLGDSKTVQVGDPTIAIGNPFGFDRTLTTGVVSALQRQITAPDGYTIENVIQTDAAINPGNSGGPLIDAGGRVIGINSQIATGGGGNGSVGIGFAVPIDTAKDVVKQLAEHGRVERPWLGLQYLPVDSTLTALKVPAKSGLLVQEVLENGPAADAGIRAGDNVVDVNGSQVALGGDVITKIDDREMRTSDDVRQVLADHKPGDTVHVVLVRDGDTREIEVTLGNRPAGKADS
jgi:S1-C subfamily serine protease